MPYSFGPGGGPAIPFTGAPVAGTNQVDTLTIGGTPTGGTFTLTLFGRTTVPITWVSVNATLLASINAAIDTIAGATQVVASAGTLTAGIGTVLFTYSGSNVGRASFSALGVGTNSLTGTSPTLAAATTTPGVEATLRGAPRGAIAVRTDGGALYVQTAATPLQPTWTAQV